MLPPGTQVGNYRIASFIDHGGFAEVYRAQSLRDGRLVALKVISRNQDEELIAAERVGASLQRRFEQAHGMVPQTFDVDEDEHYFYIAMACIEEPSLAAEIARGSIAPDRAARHAVLICQFLERAHRFATQIDEVRYDKIIHADLKPSHIFAGGDGRITVLDFGIAKALENSRTAKTIRFVTPLYASPQRLETGRGSEHDDLWALAVMLYEMIRGKRPHSTVEDPPIYARVSRAIQNNAEREPLPASCPAALAAIVDRALRYQEELRYESATAMRSDLEAYLRREPPCAMKRFATPATIKANTGTPSIVQSTPIVPTVPRPAAGPMNLPAAGGVAVIEPAAPAVAVRKRSLLRRAALVMTLACSLPLFTSEAVAWLRTERMGADLSKLDVRSVAATQRAYERLRRSSVFHIGQRRLARRLKQRLVAAAGAVIADYRQDGSTVAEAQWRQASQALNWASQLPSSAVDDESIESKRLICDGHLDRIAAQTRRTRPEAKQLYDRAIAEFERAARLDPRAVDPYLGLGRIYIYARNEVDRGAAAIHEAESRGHTPGWRERALLGDGYRQRADVRRRTVLTAPEESRRAVLESARDDYARCVDMLAPILDKARSKYNHGYCQRHVDELNRLLEADAPQTGQQ